MWIVKMKVPNSSSVIWCCPVIATCCYQGNCKIEVFAVSANLYSRNTLQDAYHYSCPNLFVYVIVFRIKCKCLNNLRTSHVEIFFFFFFFYIFTSCVGTYLLWENTISDNTLFQIFMKIVSLFLHVCLPIQIPEWVCIGDTENHYETRPWCAVDFNNLKLISSSSVDAFEITCSCMFF